jgi:hypothetical protein
MNLKLASLFALLIPTTAMLAEGSSLEEKEAVVSSSNTCRYVGIGLGVPNLDLNFGVRKQWQGNGIDLGINAEMNSTTPKKIDDLSQVLGYLNYLLFPSASGDGSFYFGFGGAAGFKWDESGFDDYDFVGEGNLLVGRSFSHKQFVQAKMGIPVEYDSEKKWINRVEGADPSFTLSYGIGF